MPNYILGHKFGNIVTTFKSSRINLPDGIRLNQNQIKSDALSVLCRSPVSKTRKNEKMKRPFSKTQLRFKSQFVMQQRSTGNGRRFTVTGTSRSLADRLLRHNHYMMVVEPTYCNVGYRWTNGVLTVRLNVRIDKPTLLTLKDAKTSPSYDHSVVVPLKDSTTLLFYPPSKSPTTVCVIVGLKSGIQFTRYVDYINRLVSSIV